MEQWRKNLYILFIVQVLALAGFSIIIPFLPLYLSEVANIHKKYLGTTLK